MNVAIIPARGGSKRIPRKNVRPFCGRPMLAWPIAAARASGLFAHVIVSTDDEEIAAAAEAHGAEVPFRRPAALADDAATTIAVVQHAVGWIQANLGPVEHACCIYPCTPLLEAADLVEGLARLRAGGRSYAFPVLPFPSPIQRALRIDAQGRLRPFWPEHREQRTQDLEPAYHDAGQYYWGRADAFLAGHPLHSEAATPVVMGRHRVLDIDTEEDWALAEAVLRGRRPAGG